MILDLPLILETRRNHALEHATLHMLSHGGHKGNMAGHSNPTGFYLLGNFSTAEVWSAATEALTRLRGGESGLAVHAGCGTNLATSALLAGTFAWLPLRSTKSTFWRLLLLPLALTFAAIGYSLSRPLGPWLQKYITTEADLGDMQIIDIIPVRKGVHRIITK
ncbi:MAG: DUF6391 domain-containing protein [Chloroflexi bacterium]|nr:DUF6391 domain-containing protein [Chloroflexota bacterium]